MFNWFKKAASAANEALKSEVAATRCGDAITRLAMSESEALKDQGNAHLSNGNLSEAAECYRQAIAQNPRYAEACTNLGFVFQLQGNLIEAVALYRKAVEYNPELLMAHQNLGFALLNLGQIDAAEESLRRVIALAPDHSGALQSLGVIYAQRGDLTQAEALLRRALELQPDYVDAYNNLGNLLKQTNRLPEAEASWRRALELQPDNASAHYNLGVLLTEANRFPEAETAYLRALELNPDYAEAHNNLGNLFKENCRLIDAEASYRRALELKPDYAEAHHNLGVILKGMRRFDEAEASCRQAIRIKPDFAGAHSNLGSILLDMHRQDEADASFRRAVELNPDFVEERWILAINQIPQLAFSPEEIALSRARFLCALAELDVWFDTERAKLGNKAVGTFQPFYLAYQEENNRDILLQYGTLCTRLMKCWQDKQAIIDMPRISTCAAVRVGIVSAHIRTHSVWDAIVKGWFQHLDGARIELHVFYLDSLQDDETHWAKSKSSSFELGEKSLEKWAGAILEKQVDVLIYPDVGMDMMTVKLASMRLAPIQVAAWGHPETTGLPTMDYYLSAEYLEPQDAQNNYTEQLIRLPHLGCHYHPAQITNYAPDLANLGIDGSVPLLLCPGTPFKYAPQHDHVLVEIAHKLGKCQFIFFTCQHRALSEKLRRRMESVFAKSNMNFNDYCAFIPWQEKSAFYGLMKRADVFLDTIGFSGFNTAMQAVECGLPVVTREGRFMRGRLASGILRRMGMTELITSTEEEYVDLVVKLVQNAEYRHDVSQRIASTRSILFDDVAPVRALEDFLINIVKRGRTCDHMLTDMATKT